MAQLVDNSTPSTEEMIVSTHLPERSQALPSAWDLKRCICCQRLCLSWHFQHSWWSDFSSYWGINSAVCHDHIWGSIHCKDWKQRCRLVPFCANCCADCCASCCINCCICFLPLLAVSLAYADLAVGLRHTWWLLLSLWNGPISRGALPVPSCTKCCTDCCIMPCFLLSVSCVPGCSSSLGAAYGGVGGECHYRWPCPHPVRL